MAAVNPPGSGLPAGSHPRVVPAPQVGLPIKVTPPTARPLPMPVPVAVIRNPLPSQPGPVSARPMPPVARSPVVPSRMSAIPNRGVDVDGEEPPMDLDDDDAPAVGQASAHRPPAAARPAGREGQSSPRPTPLDAVDRSFASGALAQMVSAVYAEIGGDAPSRQRALMEMTAMLSQALSLVPVRGSAFAATGLVSLVTQAWRDGQRDKAQGDSLSGDFLGALEALQDGIGAAQGGLRGLPPATGGAESLIQSAMLQASSKMVEAILDPRCRVDGDACVFGASSVPALAAKFQRPIFEASYLALERLERESDAGSLSSAIVSMATLVAGDYVHRAKVFLGDGGSPDISSFDEKVFLPSIKSASQALSLTLEHASRMFDTFCQSDPQAARPRF